MRLFLTFILAVPLFGREAGLLEKPVFQRSLERTSETYPTLLEDDTSSDNHNKFLKSEHFRVIFGKNGDALLEARGNQILKWAENSWAVEVEKLGFQNPRNTERYFLDIYIGNRDSWNGEKGGYETISGMGRASTYSDGTAYMVLNPKYTDEILQSTVAHEFFHTIQYKYLETNLMSNEVWSSNIWFLEATAIAMEEEVNSTNDDYISFLNDYFDYTNLDLDDSRISYGKGLLFRFFAERDGDMEVVKDTLERADTETPLLEVLEKRENFREDLTEFGVWLKNPEKYFQDGSKYTGVKTGNSVAGKYGFLFLDGDETYLYSSNPQYSQTTFSGETGVVKDLENGLIVCNFSDEVLKLETINKNFLKQIELQKGWNMIGNPFQEYLYLEEYFPDDLVWIWRDEKYVGFSKKYSAEIQKYAYYTAHIYPGEGAWVYSENDRNVSISGTELAPFPEFSEEYKFVAFGSSFSDMNGTIFHYENGWKVYGVETEFPELEEIEPMKGYFIKGD
jgi:hypothetical protein